MGHLAEIAADGWTAVDLVERFGPIPLSRVRHAPPPGTATERDVIQVHDQEKKLCELVDGVLVEKTVGTYESYLAGLLVHFIWMHVQQNNLGIVLPPDGMMRLAPGLVRIPDVSFISWQRLPQQKVPRDPIANVVPDLAGEIISKSNTSEEMERKLSDYFTGGVRQVWYVYPRSREVRVHTGPEQYAVLSNQNCLEGGRVLPGFSLPLQQLFAEPHNTPN